MKPKSKEDEFLKPPVLGLWKSITIITFNYYLRITAYFLVSCLWLYFVQRNYDLYVETVPTVAYHNAYLIRDCLMFLSAAVMTRPTVPEIVTIIHQYLLIYRVF